MYNFSKLFIMIMALTISGVSTSVYAKDAGSITTKSLSSYIDKVELDGGNLRLANGTDKISAVIHVSTRASVESIKIKIKFINSVSLSKDRSQLRFRFNGQVIGQVPLDPLYPEGSINLTIPSSNVHSGDNILQFESSFAYSPSRCIVIQLRVMG
ncbi:MAG: cellulose biosynthesis cyclic di-GMP-binding regulatory protein BcsB [Ghiorsea sp.]|nr:cellulose biosynthesis cyclic di-GMP-binding regulatory protein BcsB [Ghiorsea sp.]